MEPLQPDRDEISKRRNEANLVQELPVTEDDDFFDTCETKGR
jgi:hypothetical protein